MIIASCSLLQFWLCTYSRFQAAELPYLPLHCRGIRAVCSKAWTGTIKTPAFDKFVVETCRTEAAARKFLADRALEHYWDLAKGDLRD